MTAGIGEPSTAAVQGRPMKGPGKRLLAAAAIIAVIVVASAFVLGPHGCEGGIEAYLAIGAVAFVVLLVLPWWLLRPASRLRQAGWSVGLALADVALWIGALLAADFRIICRLF